MSSDAFIRSNAADVKSSGDLNFSDNVKATFGASSDLQIYHDGNDSWIYDSGSGNLNIRANDFQVVNSANTQAMIYAAIGGAVNLYYAGAAKLATTSSGISVTGNVAVTGTVDGRDVATDGAKLDGIETNADATDTTNVVAALTAGTNVSIAANGTISSTDTNTTYSVGDGGLTQKNFTTTLKSKLDGIATGATANVGDITGVTAGTNLNGGGSSGGVTVNLDANITLTTVTATNFNTTSDRNTKKDITPIADAVRKVQQLGGYNFTFKDTDEKSSGVIAQEVQEVLPELVQEGDEGHLTVQYGNMVGLLIEAIKEQQTQIDELKEKLNS